MDTSENEKSSESEETGEKSVKVKSEPEEDTIKNYAQHTMNELLGLFGYEDKVNSTDTENLNLDSYTETNDVDSASSDVGSDVNEKKSRPADKLKANIKKRLLPLDDNILAQQHMNLVTALKRREKEAELTEGDEALESESRFEIETSQACSWCRKPVDKTNALDGQTGSKVFCDEVCFTQCRRASFKNIKTCDWCKHVRHTANYVRFQDGETQLKFCSEKCLNQYKMSIFCKETQEHLQKMSKNGEEMIVSKDGEKDKEILITPELWMRSEQTRRAAEARESARERERRERREERDIYRKSHNTDKISPLKNSPKIDSSEKSRLSLLDRIKNEARLKRNHAERETDKGSPTRSDTRASSPSPNTDPNLPAHMLHPSIAINPWLHQAHLMGALPPGMLPYGHIPPMMLSGWNPAFLPPPPATIAPDNRDKEDSEHEKKTGKRESGSHSVRQPHVGLLSPGSDRSALSTSSPRHEHQHSPGLSDRRTSSLFPVDFPQFFAGQNGSHENVAQRSGIPGIPPVTMMVPFPVPLPLPVPIPIPIPLTMKQLTSIFGETDKSEKDEKQNVPKISSDRKYDTRSPLPSRIHSPHSVTSVGSEYNSYDKIEGRSGSRNSCPDLSLFVNMSESRGRRSESYSYKRSRTPESMTSLDLSRHSKIPRYEYKPDSIDGAIDLSSTRDNGHKSEDNASETSLVNGNTSDDSSFLRDDNDNYTEDGPPVPKIHIITHKNESPLNQPLPLPPTENPYSSRRGLILDAPVIPKKSRSPSPDRRVYVRNVPRDIIEAARRRCMRSRVRTK